MRLVLDCSALASSVAPSSPTPFSTVAAQGRGGAGCEGRVCAAATVALWQGCVEVPGGTMRICRFRTTRTDTVSHATGILNTPVAAYAQPNIQIAPRSGRCIVSSPPTPSTHTSTHVHRRRHASVPRYQRARTLTIEA